MLSADLSTASKVFIVTTIVETMVVIALSLERIFYQDEFNTMAKVALILCFVTIFMLYFAIDGVLSENRFELVCFLFATLMVSFSTVYSFVLLSRSNGPQTIVIWVRLIAVSIFCPLNFVLGWFAFKSFGWQFYRLIGANVTLQDIYKKYQIFMSLLKLDLLFGTGLVLGVGLFQLDDHLDFYLDLAMVPATIGWAVLGWFGVHHEERISMGAFLSFAVLEPIYIVWKAVGWINASPSSMGIYTFVVVCVAACIALLCRLFLMCFAIMAYANFEKGLKVIFEKKNPASHDEEVLPFLNS